MNTMYNCETTYTFIIVVLFTIYVEVCSVWGTKTQSERKGRTIMKTSLDANDLTQVPSICGPPITKIQQSHRLA